MSEILKQIGEAFTVAVDFTPKLPANAALVSGVLLATRRGKTQQTTLAAAVLAGATTVTLAADVRAGAQVIVNPGQIDEEPLLILSITGAGPYVAALARPAQLAHAGGAPASYDVGDSALVLANTVATIAGARMKANVIGGLVYSYDLVFLATLTTGEILRQDVALIIND